MTKVRAALLVSVLVAPALTAQQQVPTFEVGSVKPNTSRDARPKVDATPGRFTATAVTLRELIKMAYPVAGSIRRDERISGGPEWIGTDRFDVIATGGPTGPNIRPAPGAVSPREGAALNAMQTMLRQLLRDRFRLSVRNEQRVLPIYSLVQARTDRLGERLRRFGGDCAKEAVVVPDTTGAACGGFKFLGGGRLVAHAVTIPMLVSILANLPDLGRNVQDHTALGGNFDLELTWTPASGGQEQSNRSQSVAPSLFTALEEQLGLKLEPTRGPADVLVIDSVERPTPN